MIAIADRGPGYREDLPRTELATMSQHDLIQLISELQTQRSAFWTYVKDTSEQIEKLHDLLQDSLMFSTFTLTALQTMGTERSQQHNSLVRRAHELVRKTGEESS